MGILTWLGTAHGANDDIWQLYVADKINYDDNLFRLSDKVNPTLLLGPDYSRYDFVNQLSVGGKIHYPISRQRVLVELRADDNRFIQNRRFDHFSTHDTLTWQWALGRGWSGNLGYGYQRSLASFAYTQFFLKDVISQQDGFFDFGYTWHPRWKLSAGLRWQESTHSNRRRRALNRQEVSGSIGLSYTTPSKNSLGLEYRYSDVDLPNRELKPDTLLDDHYRIQTLGAVANWRYSGKTRVEGRFGYSMLENRHYPQRDFSGVTFRLSAEWEPTGKTRFNLAGWRELQPSQTLDASYMVSQGVSLYQFWNATAKILVTGGLIYEALDFEGSPGLAVEPLEKRRDRLWSGLLGVSYAPQRHLEFGLSYQAQWRTSSRPFLNYADNSLSVSAKLRF